MSSVDKFNKYRAEEIDKICEDCTLYEDLQVEAAEYQGRKVKLNDPSRSSDGKKKFYVYVKNEKGNVIKLGFGDPNMEIKRDQNGKPDIGLVINGELVLR